jgi:hypothetical protein
MKRVIALLIAILFLIGCADNASEEEITLQAPVEKNVELIEMDIIDFEYEYSEELDGIIITAYIGTNTDVVIPTIINNYPVICFGETFSGNEIITSIIIKFGIAHIYENAFKDCISLEKIIIPNSVTSIGSRAFWGCISLEEIVIPESVTNMGTSVFAFASTAWLDPYADGIIYIGTIAYSYKGELPEDGTIIFENGTTEIADFFINENENLVSIIMPDSVTNINWYAFAWNPSLEYIIFSNNLNRISPSALHETAWLDNQPNGVIYVGNTAILYKGDMPENTHITIKEGTEKILSTAFSWKENLVSITIPDSVIFIDDLTFIGTSLDEKSRERILEINPNGIYIIWD